MSARIAVVGANGQISLGKKHAGETVMINQVGKSTWQIESGQFIPESEKWLYADPKALAQLDRALERTKHTKPVDNFDQFLKDFESGKYKNRHK